MTTENNDRIGGQNEQKIHSPEYIRERIQSSGSYKLIPITGKRKMPQRKLSLQQEKMLIASTFVKALKPLLFITYRFTCEKISYYRCAMRHVLHWVSGSPPNLVIDYSKVLVASGNRFNTERAVAKPVGETVLFKWQNDLIPKDYATDKVILVAYCEALNKCIFTTMGPPRSAGKAKLEVAAFRGQAIHTWLSFITADGRQVADSIYTGKLIVNR
jgi:hypothetical protein